MGRTFHLNAATTPPILVVGVSADVLNYSLVQDALPFFYLPVDQHPTPALTLLVRSSRAAPPVAADVAVAIRSVAPDILPFNVQPMTEAIASAPDGLLLPRLGAWIGAAFGLVGLVLSLVGVHGVVAQAVGERAREMAVRVAIGARPGDVRRELLGGAATAVGCGLVGGFLAAAVFARATATWYFGIAPWDARAFVVGPALVVLTAFSACLGPIRRATRADPVSVLKGV